MTNKKQELEQRLNREFEICDRHILRIEEALDELTDLLPMSVEDYVGLNSEQIRCLDQFFQASRCYGGQNIPESIGISG